MHAETPEPVYGMPRISSSSWTVPSSPSRPCSATNATSGRSPLSSSTRPGPTSTGRTSWPSRCSASWTRAPDRSDTWRSSERPPLRTATRLTDAASRPLSSAGALGGQPQDLRELLLDHTVVAVGLARRRGRTSLLRGGVDVTAGMGRLDRRSRPGQRAVHRHLFADDLADPPDPLPDPVLA